MAKPVPGAFTLTDVNFDGVAETVLSLYVDNAKTTYLLWDQLSLAKKDELHTLVKTSGTAIDPTSTSWVCAADTVRFTGTGLTVHSVVGIAAGTYNLNVNVDGAGAVDVPFAVKAGATFQQLVNDGFLPALAVAFPAATVSWTQVNATTLDLVVTSGKPGTSGSVAVIAGTTADLIAAVEATVAWTAAVGAPVAGVDGLSTLDVANEGAYQVVNVGGAKAGGTATGLANDATVYTATVVVNGVSQPITVTGTAAQTYTTLLAELNTDTSDAEWSIVGGNLQVEVTATGVGTSVAVTNGVTNPLFSSLTDYVAINAAVASSDVKTWKYRLTAAKGLNGSSFLESVGTAAFVDKGAKPARQGLAVETAVYYNGTDWKYYGNDVAVGGTGTTTAPPEA